MVKIQKYQKFIVANWKLNGSINFPNEYFGRLVVCARVFVSLCLVLCPPAPKGPSLSKNSEGVPLIGQGLFS
jgi:hypothetical protein